MFKLTIYFLSSIIHFAFSEVYFEEEFSADGYAYNWVESSYREPSERGRFKLSAGNTFGDIWRDRGLQTSENAKFYAISTKFNKTIATNNKTLIIQFQIKMEESINCGGGYIKILGSDFHGDTFHSETPYKIMFGPDICGKTKRMVHIIINYNEKYYFTKKSIKCKTDRLSHLYTLILTPKNTYRVLIDNKMVEEGRLKDDFDILSPKIEEDPTILESHNNQVNENIIAEEGKDSSKLFPDPNTSKTQNSNKKSENDYKNDKEKKEKNKIDKSNSNDYLENYVPTDLGGLGFDIWQVVAGSIFDNILITDDADYAFEVGESLWKAANEDEIKIYKHKENYERMQQEELKRISEVNKDEIENQNIHDNYEKKKDPLTGQLKDEL